MRPLVVRERAGLERDVARAWWKLQPQSILSLDNGQRCLLVYSGQAGGSAGPDVRNAVLRLLPERDEEEADQLAGDVEFHLRASDWFVHGHQRDPRYNRVILHVVYYLDSAEPTRRQDGSLVPTCSLLDLTLFSQQASAWPCQLAPLAPFELTSTLLQAGLRRFHTRSEELAQKLSETRASGLWSRHDLALLPAIAEGLGYGRDRAFFRAAGRRLLGLPAPLPEPLGHSPQPARLDASRLRILRALFTRWQASGAWPPMRRVLEQNQGSQVCLGTLRALFRPLGQARTDILIVNSVLPFAAAVAASEQLPRLAARAQHLYLACPALASNHITRAMSAQLQLPAEPARACLQQGLHDIYQRTCQAKDCQHCPCGDAR